MKRAYLCRQVWHSPWQNHIYSLVVEVKNKMLAVRIAKIFDRSRITCFTVLKLIRNPSIRKVKRNIRYTYTRTNEGEWKQQSRWRRVSGAWLDDVVRRSTGKRRRRGRNLFYTKRETKIFTRMVLQYVRNTRFLHFALSCWSSWYYCALHLQSLRAQPRAPRNESPSGNIESFVAWNWSFTFDACVSVEFERDKRSI